MKCNKVGFRKNVFSLITLLIRTVGVLTENFDLIKFRFFDIACFTLFIELDLNSTIAFQEKFCSMSSQSATFGQSTRLCVPKIKAYPRYISFVLFPFTWNWKLIVGIGT